MSTTDTVEEEEEGSQWFPFFDELFEATGYWHKRLIPSNAVGRKVQVIKQQLQDLSSGRSIVIFGGMKIVFLKALDISHTLAACNLYGEPYIIKNILDTVDAPKTFESLVTAPPSPLVTSFDGMLMAKRFDLAYIRQMNITNTQLRTAYNRLTHLHTIVRSDDLRVLVFGRASLSGTGDGIKLVFEGLALPDVHISDSVEAAYLEWVARTSLSQRQCKKSHRDKKGRR